MYLQLRLEVIATTGESFGLNKILDSFCNETAKYFSLFGK